jgi:hypothetical protein
MAQELEDALGGVYSVLSQELQYPLALRILNMLPKLPPEVEPTIVTGFEALGRGHDLQKLDALMQHIAPLGPDVIGTWVQLNDYIARVCVALGIDKTGLITSKEQVEAQMKQAEQMAMIEKFMPMIQKMMADGSIPNGMQQGGQPNEQG